MKSKYVLLAMALMASSSVLAVNEIYLQLQNKFCNGVKVNPVANNNSSAATTVSAGKAALAAVAITPFGSRRVRRALIAPTR